jgi:TnpA family transposase
MTRSVSAAFALNALVLWNAQYLDDAIAHLRATGHEITDEDGP